MDEDRDIPFEDDALEETAPPTPSRRRRAWWLLGLGAVAGALALNSPKVRKLMTVNDVATGRTPEYPDIQTRTYDRPAEEVLNAAVTACERLGWRVVQEDRLENHVQAETSARPGFMDDLNIRISPGETGQVVHVRSQSRTGRGDFGENARHIRALQREMDRLLP